MINTPILNPSPTWGALNKSMNQYPYLGVAERKKAGAKKWGVQKAGAGAKRTRDVQRQMIQF